MTVSRTFLTLFTAATLCTAQAVDISGVVKDNTGSAVEGALVRLGMANLVTTTDSEGKFQLAETTTGVKFKTDRPDFTSQYPVTLRNNSLVFDALEQATVGVQVYDCNGRRVFSHNERVSSTKYSLALPHRASGISICRVAINNEQFTFRTVAGMASNRFTASSPEGSAPAKHAATTTLMEDALLVTKEGYLLYRLPVTKPDTSDLQITLTPQETGTVTDIDGNVYKTVRIGKQFWTAENLRTTKYNDGSKITLVTSNGSWGFGTGYCFYDNSTDPAEQKKWGALYNFAAVKTGKLAPKGWHVATDAEWDTLQVYLMANGYNFDGTISELDRGSSESDENKIAKSLAATTDWEVDSTGTGSIGNDLSLNNASGFSALPAGSRYYDGTFTYKGTFAFFWTSSDHDASFSWYRLLWDVITELNRGDRVKSIGCSIRLVRDN